MLLDQNVMVITLGLTLLWLVILSVLLFRSLSHYRKLTKGTNKKDLRSVLEKMLAELGEKEEKIKVLTTEIEKIKKETQHDIQKIGLVRYNPFSETGGNQSFCLSILDGHNSGLVISSLHGRESTRIYAKPVKNGRSFGFKLSEEEEQAIKKAKKIK